MSYKTILVYFRGESEAEALCAAADQVAARHEAHVIGLFVLPNVEALPVMGFPVPAGVKETYTNLHLQWAEGAMRHFNRFAKNRPNWEWRQIDSGASTMSRVLADHACTADLVIVGQPAKGTSFIEPDMTFETALMGTGRAVLIVPQKYSGKTIGTNTVIGWNGTREAARAAFDAIDLMDANQKSETTLFWVGDSLGKDTLPGAEMATTMARHGIKVEAAAAPKTGGIGPALLARAKDRGADLLVMGCFGHSQIREFIFGGATEHVLGHMELPVMMSR